MRRTLISVVAMGLATALVAGAAEYIATGGNATPIPLWSGLVGAVFGPLLVGLGIRTYGWLRHALWRGAQWLAEALTYSQRRYERLLVILLGVPLKCGKREKDQSIEEWTLHRLRPGRVGLVSFSGPDGDGLHIIETPIGYRACSLFDENASSFEVDGKRWLVIHMERGGKTRGVLVACVVDPFLPKGGASS